MYLIQDLQGKEKKATMDSSSTIRLVARLSTRCWMKADKIFDMFEQGKVKGQRKVKGELGLPTVKSQTGNFCMG